MFEKKFFSLFFLISIICILEVKSTDITPDSKPSRCQNKRTDSYGQIIHSERFQNLFFSIPSTPSIQSLRQEIDALSNAVSRHIEQVARAEEFLLHDPNQRIQQQVIEDADKQNDLEAEVDRLVMCEMQGVDRNRLPQLLQQLLTSFQMLNNFVVARLDKYNRYIQKIKDLKLTLPNPPQKVETTTLTPLKTNLPPLSNTFNMSEPGPSGWKPTTKPVVSQPHPDMFRNIFPPLSQSVPSGSSSAQPQPGTSNYQPPPPPPSPPMTPKPLVQPNNKPPPAPPLPTGSQSVLHQQPATQFQPNNAMSQNTYIPTGTFINHQFPNGQNFNPQNWQINNQLAHNLQEPHGMPLNFQGQLGPMRKPGRN